MKNWEIIASLLEREEHALGSVVEYMIHGYQSRNIPAQNIREESNSECPADNELLMPCKNTQTFWQTIEREFEHHFQDIDAHFNKLFKLRTRRPGAKKLQPLDPWWYLEDLEDSFEDVKEYLLIRNRTKCECLFKKLKNEIKKGMEPTPPTCPSVLGSIPLERKFRYVHQMLNLEESAVCSLLPFLLTAYICNFSKNFFILRGSTSVENAFINEECGVPLSQYNFIIESLKSLSRIFGFKDFFTEIKEVEPPKNSEMVRPAVFQPSSFPNLEDRHIRDLVFETWCVVIYKYLAGNTDPVCNSLLDKISFSDSYILYLYYNNQHLYSHYLAESGTYSDSEILSDIFLRYEGHLNI